MIIRSFQAVVSVAVAIVVPLLWSGKDVVFALRAAALPFGRLRTKPFLLAYDLIIFGFGITSLAMFSRL